MPTPLMETNSMLMRLAWVNLHVNKGYIYIYIYIYMKVGFEHLLRSTRVLNNTEVKGHYSTICRHACFGVRRLISAAWYTSTYVAALHLYT